MKQKSTGTQKTTIIGTEENTENGKHLHNITCKQKLEQQAEYPRV